MAGITLDFVTPDWESQDWACVFYPDDLPDAWRLAYYSNEFPSVLLPASRWMSMAEAEWEEWRSDTPEGFRIYLELPAQQRAPMVPYRVRELLAGRLTGGLAREPVQAEALPAASGVPLYRLMGDSSPDGLAGFLPAVSPLDSGARDLRATQAWLADLSRRFGGGPVLVVLDGGTADAEVMRRWWQLAWLMGLA